MLLDLGKNFVFTLSLCLPIAAALTHVCTAECEVLIALVDVAFRRRTFRDILCHSRLPLGNSPANPEQRRENRELVHTELRAPFRGLRYSVLSTHMD